VRHYIPENNQVNAADSCLELLLAASDCPRLFTRKNQKGGDNLRPPFFSREQRPIPLTLNFLKLESLQDAQHYANLRN